MADTTPIKTQIEPYVRKWLGRKIPGLVFTERLLPLTSGLPYNFDAVSQDTAVVGAILCNRPRTRTGRENTGGVRKALLEVGWLRQLPSETKKVMVFTDSGFCELFRRRAKQLGIQDIQLMVCQLPPALKESLMQVLDEASREQRAAE
jgi:hypothetical protein